MLYDERPALATEHGRPGRLRVVVECFIHRVGVVFNAEGGCDCTVRGIPRHPVMYPTAIGDAIGTVGLAVRGGSIAQDHAIPAANTPTSERCVLPVSSEIAHK